MDSKLTRRRFVAGTGAAMAAISSVLVGCADTARPIDAEPLADKAASKAETQPSVRSTDMSSLKNIVLVHGAWADGSSWSGVIRILQDQGFVVTAAPLPLASLAGDADVVRGVLAAQDGPTLLVGHSYGGAVITAAGDGPKVAGLVYVAAFAPEENETLGQLAGRLPAPVGNSFIRPDKGGYLWVDAQKFPEAFAQDVEINQARIMAAVQMPLAAAIFGQSPGRAAWKTKPTWYQVSDEDRMINPELERFMAKRMGAQTMSLPTGHASLVSRPREIAKLITDAATSIRPS